MVAMNCYVQRRIDSLWLRMRMETVSRETQWDRRKEDKRGRSRARMAGLCTRKPVKRGHTRGIKREEELCTTLVFLRKFQETGNGDNVYITPYND